MRLLPSPSPRGLRRPAAAAWLVLLLALLASCARQTIPAAGPSPQPGQAEPGAPIAVTPGEAAPAPPEATAGKVVVGLLLPLTGANANIGHALLDAAQMALYDVADEHLELVIRDSGGTQLGAAAAARSALGEGAHLLLGPLLAVEVEGAKPVAQAAHVPLLAFSNTTQLAGAGAWLLGFDPRQEIERVTLYAHLHGHDKFAAFAPRSAYGDLAVTALRDAVAKAHAALTRVGNYDPNVAALAPTVQRFAAGGTADYDALLLPEGGARLKALVPLLPFYGIDPDQVKLLGTGLWDEPGLGTEPALQGGWYAAPAPAQRTEFEQRFAELYKRKPPRLATLGYDATALASVLARNPAGADFSPAALTNPSGFAGLDGIFRLMPDGTVQRGLAVLEVRRGAPGVLDQAPQSFEQIGY